MKDVRIDGDRGSSTIMAVSQDPDERRREPRYVPVMEAAYLGWWDGEAFRTEYGRLVNISAGGAALEIDDSPDIGESAWLCVIGPNRMGWVAARLLGRQGNTVRMVFAEKFPYELFKSVVWGFPAEELEHEPEPTGATAEPGAELSPCTAAV